MIYELDIEAFPRVKRFGLPIFHQDLLIQYCLYSQSLFALNVLRRPDMAVAQLAKALKRPRVLCHQVTKKVLLLLIEILKKNREKQLDQVDKTLAKSSLQVGRAVNQIFSHRETQHKDGSGSKKNSPRNLAQPKMKRRFQKSLDCLPPDQVQTLTQLQQTEQTLQWAQLKLTPYFVHRRAIHFVLDATFEHSWQFEKCVNFIC